MIKQFSLILLFWSSAIFALPSAEFFTADSVFDDSLQDPAAFYGFSIGERHLRPDQIAAYMHYLAEQSPRVSLTVTGHSWEHRPLFLLAITSSANQSQLEALREKHLNNDVDAPVVLWNGYSVHGNESSGANAAVLFAWYLAAGVGSPLDQYLDNTVVLIDPILNPDGLARAANWFNSNRSQNPVGILDSRIHKEAWPNGRTNHYWFDLNRDWLPLQHPESRARVAQYYRWRPHVLTDFHEMGSESSYFFQPGVASRQNPLTPQKNFDLTREIAGFHAAAFDRQGQLYFTQDRFDDFYYGKGSTYPDVTGGIGILFEQASTRGDLANSSYGAQTWAESIKNQVTTSVSSLKASNELSAKLRDYRRWFDSGSESIKARSKADSWVIGDAGDPQRLAVLVAILRGHQIDVSMLNKQIVADGMTFSPGHAAWIDGRQPSFRLIESLFEQRTEFQDNAFYDVSTWNLPHSFGLPYARTRQGLGSTVWRAAAIDPVANWTAEFYAALIPWGQKHAARVLYKLLDAGIKVRVAESVFAYQSGESLRHFDAGTLVVPYPANPGDRSLLAKILDVATGQGVEAIPVFSGLTPEGSDLGSHRFAPLKKVSAALVTGAGVSSYDAGEVWHLADHEIEMPLVRLDMASVEGTDLDQFSHLLMVNGKYKKLGKKAQSRLESWVERGGILVTTQDAAVWAGNKLFLDEDADEEEKQAEARNDVDKASEEPEQAEVESRLAYADHEKESAERQLGGALLAVDLDTTHPLGWGMPDSRTSVFKKGSYLLEPIDNSFETVASFEGQPLVAGYLSEFMREKVSGSPAITAQRKGKGAVISFAFNPNFRAIMHGTRKLYENAVFFSSVIKKTDLKE